MRVFFIGTPDYAVPSIKGLIDAGHEIVGILCQPDKPVGRKRVLTVPPTKVFAEENNIPVFQPNKVSEANDDIKALKPDILIVVAFGKLIPESTLAIGNYPPINAHASLLPAFRGAAPAGRSIIAGCGETGVSIMQVVKALDAGPVMHVRRCDIVADETRWSLLSKLSELSVPALQEALVILEEGKAKFADQDDSATCYAAKINREDGLIDWQQASTVVYNRYRGVSPAPGAYSHIQIADKCKRIIFTVMKPLHEDDVKKTVPGTILSCDKTGIVVACKAGAVCITSVKPEGKGSMDVQAFINGQKIKSGDVFISPT